MKIKANTLWPNIKSQRAAFSPSSVIKRVTYLIQRRPFLSFGAALLLLLGLIIVSSLFFKPQTTETPKANNTKEVKVYSIGSVPKIRVQAQIEKSGVIKIVSLTGGVVSSINVSEGEQVDKGANLINLVSDYQGENAAGLQLSFAAKQAQLTADTFNTQKDIIAKQKEVANQTESNASQLRDISSKSLIDTHSLIDLNQSIVDTLNNNLTNLQNSGGSDADILAAKQLVSQMQSAQLQLRSSQRNLDYQSNGDKPPAQLARLQKDLTLEQLDIQEKSLQLNKEVSQLQVALASVNASLFHPVAPVSGTIERIYVREGQMVSPGTPLLMLSDGNKRFLAVAKVPNKIARSVSQFEPSSLLIGNNILALNPGFISDEATDSQMYAIIFTLPDSVEKVVTDGEYIPVDLPVGLPNTTAAVPFIPLDAVFQTEDQSIVYLVKDGKAAGKNLKLGNVVGGYVEVLSGLQSGDQVILDRTVIEGDAIKIGA
jgi:RND family efflux transporter MFP subunit